MSEMPPVLRAVAFHGRENTFAKPFRVTCDDGCRYVVKARQLGRPIVDRSLVTSHVAGRLGEAIGAPVPPVALIELTRTFLLEHGLTDIVPGLAHGSRELHGMNEGNCAARFLSSEGARSFEGWEIPSALLPILRAPENRERLARLALLRAWLGLPGPAWQSLLYEAKQPALVHGIDFEYHGRALPEDASDWLTLALDTRVGLTLADLHDAVGLVGDVSLETLAAVTETPDEWGARWSADLGERRAWLLSTLPAVSETEACVA